MEQKRRRFLTRAYELDHRAQKLARLPDLLATQHRLDLMREPIEIDRLADKTIEAGGAGLDFVLEQHVCGQCHNPGCIELRVRPDLFQDCVPIFIRQLNVEQDQIDLGHACSQLEPLPTGSAGVDVLNAGHTQ